MKTCSVCSKENVAEAVTCVACGEGSFAPVESDKMAPEVSKPEAADAVVSPDDEPSKVKPEEAAGVNQGSRRRGR